MQVKLLPIAEDDLQFWIKTNNRIVLKKITQLTESILVTPYDGIGKPEQLKHNLTGVWSRRINKEHRLVYEIQEDKIIIHSLRALLISEVIIGIIGLSRFSEVTKRTFY